IPRALSALLPARPIEPRPPAFETAAAIAGVAVLAIGAWTIGTVRPSFSRSGFKLKTPVQPLPSCTARSLDDLSLHEFRFRAQEKANDRGGAAVARLGAGGVGASGAWDKPGCRLFAANHRRNR